MRFRVPNQILFRVPGAGFRVEVKQESSELKDPAGSFQPGTWNSEHGTAKANLELGT